MTRYILLNESDTIEAGDECLAMNYDNERIWCAVRGSIGRKAGKRNVYRRKIDACCYCGRDPLSTEGDR